MWVAVGLGNPGGRYHGSRHNMGFEVIDRLAERWNAGSPRAVHRALLSEARYENERVLLVKPQTYMNESGVCVTSLTRFYRFPLERTIVVHDDLDLPVGSVRLKLNGGSGGNHGVESMIAALGSRAFVRLRIGVGRPPPGWDTAGYVLARPGPEELPCLGRAADRAVQAVELVVTKGATRAMDRINQREISDGRSPL